jgi:hypothetical protein
MLKPSTEPVLVAHYCAHRTTHCALAHIMTCPFLFISFLLFVLPRSTFYCGLLSMPFCVPCLYSIIMPRGQPWALHLPVFTFYARLF